MKSLRIGARGSALALWQARYIQSRLEPLAHPRPVELVEIKTLGDISTSAPLSELGGQGVFTKEIQQALLDDRIDVAVHSLKDLPTFAVSGLTLAAVPPRAPTGDALISRQHSGFASLPEGARVATSSLRRRAQLLHQRPDLRLEDIRGNVDTRLNKLETEQLDAIVLAEAGLVRLGLDGVITEILDSEWFLPAVGQGALGVECRADDSDNLPLIQKIDHPDTHDAILAERAFLRTLEGGCHVPIGALAKVNGSHLYLRVAVLSPSGSKRLDEAISGDRSQAERMGTQLAEKMLDQGAKELLEEGE